MFYHSFMFFFTTESLSSAGRSVQNFAPWSVLDFVLKIRSKIFGGSFQNKWDQKLAKFGMILDNFSV